VLKHLLNHPIFGENPLRKEHKTRVPILFQGSRLLAKLQADFTRMIEINNDQIWMQLMEDFHGLIAACSANDMIYAVKGFWVIIMSRISKN